MRRATPFLLILLGVYLTLGVIYSLVTPVFEASDELSHYPVVKHIADGQGLPVQNPAVAAPWQQEGSQPPLYYALAALTTFWIDTDDLSSRLWYNPHANIGQPLAPGNKNLVVHTEHEAFPWQGAVLAVHLIRFLSLLLQAATVVLTYLLAQALVPGQRSWALVAAAFVAFNPMFLFIAASVNNDNLVVPLATFILWRLVVLWRRPRWPRRWEVLLLGVALGLAALTKLSGLALGVLAAGVLTAVAARRNAWRAWLGWGLTLAACVAAIAGWWYVRNWQLYGDPTGLNMMLEIAGRRPAGFGLRDLLAEFEGFRLSYWGVFGGFNIVAPRWVYWLYDALLAAALAGWAWRLARSWRKGERPDSGSALILLTGVLLVGGALIRWTSQTYASQGRLLFPVIGAVAVLAVIGIASWLPRKVQEYGLAGITTVLAGLALVMPLAIIAPAYAQPPILTLDQVPASAVRVDQVHGETLRLLAYELPQPIVRSGQRLPVVVYWQSVAATQENLSVYVHLLGRKRAPVGEIGTYPGGGASPTSLLHPGDVIRDLYSVPVNGDAVAPTLLYIDVGLYRYGGAEETGLPVADASGQPSGGSLGVVRLLPHARPSFQISQPLQFDFDGRVTMSGYDLSSVSASPGETITLTLYWQPQARLAEDFQVFVHLTNAGGETLAQGDKAPLDGDWPATAWEPGLAFRDEYPILLPADMPAGVYDLQVGLYRLTDGWRLPVTGSAGPLSDAAATLAKVEVR